MALLIAAIILLPLIVRPVVASEIWIFAIAAMALNLIFGSTGMLSFGQATFFGGRRQAHHAGSTPSPATVATRRQPSRSRTSAGWVWSTFVTIAVSSTT